MTNATEVIGTRTGEDASSGDAEEGRLWASPLLNRQAAAKYLAIGLSTLAEMTAQRLVPSVKIGRRRLYRRQDLDEWIDAQVEGTGPTKLGVRK